MYLSTNVLLLKETERYVFIKDSYYFPLLVRQVSFLINSYVINYKQPNEARIWSYEINFYRYKNFIVSVIWFIQIYYWTDYKL